MNKLTGLTGSVYRLRPVRPVEGCFMDIETSRKPVVNQFSLKRLIFNKLQRENTRPVEKRLQTSKFKELSPSLFPNEFTTHVEQVRSAWPDGPPMQCQDVPDWSAFCVGWWRDCFQCPYYDANPASSPCALLEVAFPGVVRWYPAEWLAGPHNARVVSCE